MFRIIEKSKYWYVLSGALIVLSLCFIFIFGLNVGIDFRGGAKITYQIGGGGDKDIVREAFTANGIDNIQIVDTGEDKIVVKSRSLDPQTHSAINENIKSKNAAVSETEFDTIGPSVGKSLTNKSILAVIIASLAIISYIAYAFRKVPKPLSPWKFGVLAVVALIHDLIITTGAVALLGAIFSWMEVDVLFITALLTIMGFSVHDTIVVYDRLRENFIRNPGKSIKESAEESVNQTLVRSINTSLTTILVLTALFLLGGTSIRHFVLTLIIGIVIGTYSSIFVAAALLVFWHKPPQLARSRGVGE